MPTASPRFSNLRSSQHNYVRPMPALKLQQNLRVARQNPILGHVSGVPAQAVGGVCYG
jgi:hypothetical protein